MTDRANPSSDRPRPDFGEPEAEFGPTFGQTVVGMVMTGTMTVVGFAAALFGDDCSPSQRFAIGSVGLVGVGLSCWVYGMRKWRLWICPGGVVQRRPQAVDEIAWQDVREVVAARYLLHRHPDHMVIFSTVPGGSVVIRPINCARYKQLFDALKKAASDRHIVVRTEVIWGD